MKGMQVDYTYRDNGVTIRCVREGTFFDTMLVKGKAVYYRDDDAIDHVLKGTVEDGQLAKGEAVYHPSEVAGSLM